MNYRTPGVYVEEVSKLPASVAQSETAIPVFIGYTEKTDGKDGESLLRNPIRISSMMDYERIFGRAPIQAFRVTLDESAPYMPRFIAFDGGDSPFLMHHALNLFFANGGGDCFVVSVGGYLDDGEPITPTYQDLKDGLDVIENNDEITLVVIPEAVKLDEEDQYELYKDVLSHCHDQINRFGIFDVREEDREAEEFRNDVGTNFLDQGAAYYPHLKTTIGYSFIPSKVTFSNGAFDEYKWSQVHLLSNLLDVRKQYDTVKIKVETSTEKMDDMRLPELRQLFKDMLRSGYKALSLTNEAKGFVKDEDLETDKIGEVEVALEEAEAENINSATKSEVKNIIRKLKKEIDKLDEVFNEIIGQVNSETNISPAHNDAVAMYYNNDFEKAVDDLLRKERVVMPPSAAMAGIYARVDANRGVWKSPANVSINRVSGPSVKLTDAENGRLNIHGSGKSINAIRAFTGKGTLVWGARTLDGGSNEWRYISVRRFFNMVEDSVESASKQFVFEPNDANTWVKVKAMIENFLILQWRAGALMGSKPEEAFFVSVGLGKTMDEHDINEGRMIVEVGMAVVRPAEFIVLRFSHKMLET